ncbi:hypothetical protein VSS37_07890 [Candidatus Thiothrix sp. Deng01]|uniref:Ribbon-helix-helix protein CopG domain-containing protein n=1 Tax=Candidatus Thiothrix phosphatis TaxID=3112415 RepID=A0ABU6CVS6_9GAMM|nr:hypothetical protein [Candidatus Thiothrix sp. Deng01]MEB4590894.1 hypothetical protein [Candidatus Thiothrix sp. Deng01]
MEDDKLNVRLRLTVRPELDRALDEIATTLRVERATLYNMCISIGLRFLDVSLINPGGGGITKAVDQRAQATAQAIAGDIQALS